MAWAYAWPKLAPFYTPLAGVLSVEDDRVRYVARSDDERSRRFIAEKSGRPELADELATRDGVTLLDFSSSELKKVKFPATQMGGGVNLQTDTGNWRFLFYEPPANPNASGQVVSRAMRGKAESTALREALKNLKG